MSQDSSRNEWRPEGPDFSRFHPDGHLPAPTASAFDPVPEPAPISELDLVPEAFRPPSPMISDDPLTSQPAPHLDVVAGSSAGAGSASMLGVASAGAAVSGADRAGVSVWMRVFVLLYSDRSEQAALEVVEPAHPSHVKHLWLCAAVINAVAALVVPLVFCVRLNQAVGFAAVSTSALVWGAVLLPGLFSVVYAASRAGLIRSALRARGLTVTFGRCARVVALGYVAVFPAFLALLVRASTDNRVVHAFTAVIVLAVLLFGEYVTYRGVVRLGESAAGQLDRSAPGPLAFFAGSAVWFGLLAALVMWVYWRVWPVHLYAFVGSLIYSFTSSGIPVLSQ